MKRMNTISESEFKNVYTHFAYISCCPADKRWASLLRLILQFYRLPAKIQRTHRNLPKNCRPITKSPDIVKENELPNALKTTKFFIVICSKHARENSSLMNAELQSFLDGGGEASRIFPFIIEDNTNPVEECFPTLLSSLCKVTNIIGANIFDDGRHTAEMKLIAAMLNLKVEELEGAEVRRKKKNRAIFIALTVLLLIGGIAYWDYNRTKTFYYMDYTEKYGAPHGIGKLTKQELAGMHIYYTIENSRGLVRKLSINKEPGTYFDLHDYGEEKNELYTYNEEKNDLLNIIKPGTSFSEAVYDYGDNRRVKSITYYNEYGNRVLLMNYVDGQTIDIEHYKENTVVPSARIKRQLVEYDSNGYITEIRYVNKRDTNQAVADDNGVFGLRYERDDVGHPVKITNLINSGGSAEYSSTYEEEAGMDGILSKEYQYTRDNELKECRYWDVKGNPTLCGDGYAGIRFRYDEKHNISQLEFVGKDGKPWRTEKGYCGIGFLYGEEGEIIGHRFLADDGRPVMNNDGYAGYNSEFKDGEENYCCFTGLDDEPVLNRFGFCSYHLEFDKPSHFVKVTYCGIDGQPIVDAERGLVIKKQKFDDSFKRKISENYYDTGGNPILNQGGVGGFNLEYDDYGCVVRKCYCDTDGMPVVNKTLGYCSFVNQYNREGLIVRQSYYDTEGKPTRCRNYLYHSIEWKYAEDGTVVEESYYDIDGNLTRNMSGVARCIKSNRTENNEEWKNYDNEGNILTRNCFSFFYYSEWQRVSDFHDRFIFIHFGEWVYPASGNLSDYFPEPKQTVKTDYLCYNQSLQHYELFRSEFTVGKMGIRIVECMITEEEYREILNAAKSRASYRTLYRQGR